MTKAKRKIIYASYELFIERDFDTIKIKDIIEKAGVTKATFYNNFPDKYVLLYMFCADYISDCILRRYDGHNWDTLQMNCFALGNDHRDFFRSIRNTSGNDEFWYFIQQYFSRIFRTIKEYNSGTGELPGNELTEEVEQGDRSLMTGNGQLTDKDQLVIDVYVNAAIYLFRNRVLLDPSASYEDIADIISGYLPDEYKVVDDPDADPASIIITDTEELIRNIYS